MVKRIIIITPFVLILTMAFINQNGIYKKYVGGRPRYSHMSLTLYENSGYNFHEWYHTRNSTSDTGNWYIIDSLIVLNSLKTESERPVYLTKKQQRKLTEYEKSNLGIDTTRFFNSDTFQIKNERIFLFKSDDIKDSSDYYYYHIYKTLYESKKE